MVWNTLIFAISEFMGEFDRQTIEYSQHYVLKHHLKDM